MKTFLITAFCIAALTVSGQENKISSDTIKTDSTKTEFSPLITTIPNFATPLFIVNDQEVLEQDVALINANDIELITILKDSASKSIYGEKARFGVVKIELKKKQRFKPKKEGR